MMLVGHILKPLSHFPNYPQTVRGISTWTSESLRWYFKSLAAMLYDDNKLHTPPARPLQ